MHPEAIDVYIDVEASVEAMSRQGILLSGVPAIKCAEDLRRYRKVIEATRPELIVQTGTAVGGSALWFADSGPDVITIDIDVARIHPRVVEAEKITILTGSSTDRLIADAVVSAAANYTQVMVVLDSDHSSRHVQREIELYGPLVSKGCYLVVEDGICDFAADGPFKPGPLDAIRACLASSPDWERDIQVESLDAVSMYPGGWWIRK